MVGSCRRRCAPARARRPTGLRGLVAEGEAPGCWRATRTCSTPGRMRNFSGGSSTSASPSMPAGTGRSESTSNVGADHSRIGRCSPPPFSPRPEGPPMTVTPSRPSSIRGRVPEPIDPAEPVEVVGDQHHGAGAMLLAARPGPAQVEPLALRAQRVGHRVEQRAQLRVAVLAALDRLGVDAERDVVDEHAPVDLGEVDRALAAVDERVEGADDVVAVDARGRARSGCACRRGCTRRAAPSRRPPWRRSPASRRRPPSRARRRRGPRRRGRASRGPRPASARSARSRACAPRRRA